MHLSSSLWYTDCEGVGHLLQSPEHGVTLIRTRFVPRLGTALLTGLKEAAPCLPMNRLHVETQTSGMSCGVILRFVFCLQQILEILY